MSSKNNPGAFRCYEAALPDEHIFVILARDPAGPATLRFWAEERERVGKTVNPDDRDRITDALRDADLMHEWREANLDPMGDGTGPTWKMVRITDDDGGPIRTLPEKPTYVAAERDGTEAVRINIEWLMARTQDLTTGQITREEFAELMGHAVASPDRRQRVDVLEAAQDSARRDDRTIRIMATMTKAIEQIDKMIEGGAGPSFSEVESVRSTLQAGLAALKLSAPVAEDWPDAPLPEEPYARLAADIHALGNLESDEFVDRRHVGKHPALGMEYGRTQPSSERPPVIDAAPTDLAHSPEVPPHRFTSFHKGERYAYARGLEIAPVHLPVCLDEMARDGWELRAIFGQTESKHVGFIFERAQPPVHIVSGLELAHGYGEQVILDTIRRESPKLRRWLEGESLDTLRDEAVPGRYFEGQGDRFVVQYVERTGPSECQLVRVPDADWPEWAIGCGPAGRGRGLEP